MGIELDPTQTPKVVYITSPTTEVTVQELVNAIREWEDNPWNLTYSKVIDAVGKADLGGGTSTAITMTLNSGWYIEFWDGVTLGIVKDGNVVGGDSDRPCRAAVGSADTVLVLGAERGVIVETGTSGLTPTESTQLMGLPDLTDIEGSSVLAKQAEVLRGLGLMQENHFLDNTSYVTYQGQKLLTTGRIRIYNNATDVGTATNVSASYIINASWTNDEMTTYKVTKVGG